MGVQGSPQIRGQMPLAQTLVIRSTIITAIDNISITITLILRMVITYIETQSSGPSGGWEFRAAGPKP